MRFMRQLHIPNVVIGRCKVWPERALQTINPGTSRPIAAWELFEIQPRTVLVEMMRTKYTSSSSEIPYPVHKLTRARRFRTTHNGFSINRHDRRARNRRDTYLAGTHILPISEGLFELEPTIRMKMQKTMQGSKTHRARMAVQRIAGSDKINSQLGIPYHQLKRFEAKLRAELGDGVPQSLSKFRKKIRQLKPGTRPYLEILDEGERLCRSVIGALEILATHDTRGLVDAANRILRTWQTARFLISKVLAELQRNNPK